MEEDLSQSLKDIGCNSNVINQVYILYKNRQIDDTVKVLRKFRCELIEQLHESQSRIDCLDFLVHKLEKEQ